MSQTVGTVKLVADVRPSLKTAFDRIAAARKITRREAVEQAMQAYIDAAVDAENVRVRGNTKCTVFSPSP